MHQVAMCGTEQVHRSGSTPYKYRITMEGMAELSVAVGDLQVLILCSATLSSYVWRCRVSRAQAPGEEALSPADRRIKQVEVCLYSAVGDVALEWVLAHG